MTAMEHPRVAEQDDSNATSHTFADFRAEIDEKRFDVPPRNIAARGVRKHQLQRSRDFRLVSKRYHILVLHSRLQRRV